MEINETRAKLAFRLSSSEWYNTIIEALRSRDGTGCSVVWDGPGGLEVKFCRVHWSKSSGRMNRHECGFEVMPRCESKSVAWVGPHVSTVYAGSSSVDARGDSLRLRGRSIELKHVLGEIDRRLARGLRGDLPLPRCLHNRDLRIDGFSFRRGANVIEISASLPSALVPQVMVECLANR